MSPGLANLCQILQSCLSPQQQLIKAAEEQLKQLEKSQGQASNLLQVKGHHANQSPSLITPQSQVAWRDQLLHSSSFLSCFSFFSLLSLLDSFIH